MALNRDECIEKACPSMMVVWDRVDPYSRQSCDCICPKLEAYFEHAEIAEDVWDYIAKAIQLQIVADRARD